MLAQLSLSLVLAASSAASPAWRLSTEPLDPAETALRDAAARDGSAGIDALRAVAQQNPDSVTSGLAHLCAGLRLLDQRRHLEALAELAHADVQRTLLRDYALEAAAQAQEALGQSEAAIRSHLGAAAEPSSAVTCLALPRAAGLLLAAGRPGQAATALTQVLVDCPQPDPGVLLVLGDAQLAAGDRIAAAATWDRLEREAPGSPQALQAQSRLKGVADARPARTAEERARLALEAGTALLGAGRTKDALAVLRAVTLAALPAPDADLARVSLARALLARSRTREALALLSRIPTDSPQAAQAAFVRAREEARRSRTPESLERVADRYRGTPWAQEALLSLANHYQKDALDDAALPWWRRLATEYPQGPYVERAVWHVALADYRAGRFEIAAQALESTARLRPPSAATPGLLYWSARARMALGQTERARQLLQETVRRFKHAYHGLRAGEVLARIGGGTPPLSTLTADEGSADEPLPEPRATRARQLLILGRFDEASQELRLLPDSSLAQATLAWIEWRQGRLRQALVTMKRAHPEWISEAGDRLPAEVWRILFPLRYEDQLRAAAEAESLDPSLVAALILQESTFDATARSRAGARGLMQVMPATGRRIARAKGQRFRRAALHDPGTSLDFGTHYLRLMSERFGGAVEKVLAAYNAGPHRVEAWTAERGSCTAEEFIEAIPFTETRQYVTTVLANRESYRRIYGLGKTAPAPVIEGARP